MRRYNEIAKPKTSTGTSTVTDLASDPASLKRTVDGWLAYTFARLGTASQSLTDAMRYAVLNGGKRVRGSLVIATALDWGCTNPSVARSGACAVELIHAYSLIHDDLPVMDDSDIRRGRPSCHKQFGEATAILAGDALQALAFDELSSSEWLTPQDVVGSVRILSRGSGYGGMIGGQSLDITLETESDVSEADLKSMHSGKTGALFKAAIELGVVAAGKVEDTSALNWAADFGRALGIAFQITDDLLDLSDSSDEIGKPIHQDSKKATYVTVLGEQQARYRAAKAREEVLVLLDQSPARCERLEMLTLDVLDRKS